jgi:hypothetical protein
MNSLAPIIHPPDENRVRIKLDAVCHDCKHWHRIDVAPSEFGQAAFAWSLKHQQHDFEFLTTERTIPPRFDDRELHKAEVEPWWLTYKENADLKIAYESVTAITISLISASTNTTLTGGQQSTSVSNATSKDIDYRISAKIQTGSSPTVSTEIRVYAVGPLNDDTPTWPDVFTGSQSTVAITNANILDQLALLGSTLVTASSNVNYVFNRCLTIAEAFGYVPKNWLLYIPHNTAVNLSSSVSAHVVNQQGIYFTSI